METRFSNAYTGRPQSDFIKIRQIFGNELFPIPGTSISEFEVIFLHIEDKYLNINFIQFAFNIVHTVKSQIEY